MQQEYAVHFEQRVKSIYQEIKSSNNKELYVKFYYPRISVWPLLIPHSFRLRGNSEIMTISLTMNSNKIVKNLWNISCKMVLKLIKKRKL